MMAGNNNMAGMNNAFGNMSMQQQQQPMMNGAAAMGGFQQPMSSGNVMASQPAPAPANDDDFGDFEGASPSKAPATSSDPLSKLISLDGLSKNAKKEDKINEPIVATPAAANYVNQQQQIQQVHKSTNAAASFQGLDGLNKPSNFDSKAPMSNRTPGQPVMASGDAGKKTSELIGMMSPQMMGTQQPQQMAQPQQQQANAAMQQQMAMQQMLLQQQMMQQQQMGMNNPNMAMNPQMQNQYMQGGMNPNMQGGMNAFQGGMNPNMQGGMNMQGMGQQGGNMMGGNMGGQANGTGGWP